MNHQTSMAVASLPGGKKRKNKKMRSLLLCSASSSILSSIPSSSPLPPPVRRVRVESGEQTAAQGERERQRESKHGTEEREWVDVKDRWQRFKRRGKVGAELATWAYCRDLPCFSLLTQTVILKAAHPGAAGTRAPKSERGISVLFLFFLFLHQCCAFSQKEVHELK